MADTRSARRAAEKAALDALSGTLVETAGDLGVADAGRRDAVTAAEDAQRRAGQILEDAKKEASELVDAAENTARKADDNYAAAWTKAKECGWNPNQLRAMGYTKPSPTRRTRTGDQAQPDETPAGEAAHLEHGSADPGEPTSAVA